MKEEKHQDDLDNMTGEIIHEMLSDKNSRLFPFTLFLGKKNMEDTMKRIIELPL